MNVLFIATKSPWPAVDGGRLLLGSTLAELAVQGHRVTLVAPLAGAEETAPPRVCTPRLLPGGPRPLAQSLIASLLRRQPLSIVRHTLSSVCREVARLVAGGGFDVVHAEQLQALAQAEPAFERGVRVVLRAQNVESDLWAATGDARRFLGFAARYEARRMARAEGAAVGRADAAVALTVEDAARLGELAGGDRRVHVVRAPFASSLPLSGSRLAGAPALVMLGSEGWLPNRDATDWFVGSIWPALLQAVPEARLHVFGNLARTLPPGVEGHPPPQDSAEVFAPGSVLVVPLRIASGVRIKILEAWARGVPVVATPQAVRGLGAEDGRDLLVADDADGFVGAFRRLHENSDLADSLVAAGRASLVARHDPAQVTEELVAVYEQVIEKTR